MGQRPSVLLLQPPGTKSYCRDGFVGGVEDERVRLPPADLACLSAELSEQAELSVLDAQAEGLDEPAALERAARTRADWVFFVSCGAAYSEDSRFLAALKRRLPRSRFVGLGDLYRDARETAFALQPFLDAILLDFAEQGFWRPLLEGRPADNVLTRAASGPARRRHGLWDAAPPRWELFALRRYDWPFSRPGPKAAVLAEAGCPYACSYCPASSLGHRLRPIASVARELESLAGLGVKEILWRDQSFGFDPLRAAQLIAAAKAAGLAFSCSTRVDLLDERLAQSLAEGGCRGVWLGVDSGDEEILRAYKKGTTRRQAQGAVAAARAAGLKVGASFVVGFPLDTRESAQSTLELAAELGADLVTFRAESSRYATDYRRDLLVRGLVPPEAMPPDTPTTVSSWHGRLGLNNADAFKFLQSARAPRPNKVPARDAGR